ncbi:hypothetical protein [Rhodococcus marinonascens]|uniref:hypothetical protein n=1 Tax=Rhodococcus marinonascens TaxID=38311 RepID=UPI000A7BB669|nr:hypothetical protein [Rhodococcus marinonascens]
MSRSGAVSVGSGTLPGVNDLLGYASVSTADQDQARQHDTLTAAGLECGLTPPSDRTSSNPNSTPSASGDGFPVQRLDRPPGPA